MDTDYCNCKKVLTQNNKESWVNYPAESGWHREDDTLVHDTCGKPFCMCDFCNKPAWGTTADGYACKKHFQILIDKLHEYQQKMGFELTRFIVHD